MVTNAALGENVPANPPLSFHATSVPVPYAPPLTMMPMSWLKPAVAVHRSAPAEIAKLVSAAGDMVTFNAELSIACQAVPSLLCKTYCEVLAAELEPATGSRSTVIRVGEYAPAAGPAPMWIQPELPWLAFHTSFAV